LDDLFARLRDVGVRQVYIEHMNLRTNNTRQRLFQVLTNASVGVKEAYATASREDHREALDEIVTDLLAKHGLNIRLGGVLRHNQPSKGTRG
jgi:hypothetical protein